MAKAPSFIDGGTALRDARQAIIMVGSVINAKTVPPTSGVLLGKPKTFNKIPSPNKPKTIDGTAARLAILTSISSVNLFLGANSSK